MAVFSSSPFTFLSATSRVSTPPSSMKLYPFRPPCSVSAPRSTVRRGHCACVRYSSNANGMAELVEGNDSSDAVAVSSGSDEEKKRKVVHHQRTFLDARSGEELLSGIKTETEAGRLPSPVASGLEELYKNYKNAVLQSGIPSAEEVILSNMVLAFDRIFLEVQDPFDFSPHHKAMREPFDYYMFGQNFIRTLVDFRNSFVGNISIFQEIEEKLKKGHNVILMSNHQSEADSAVIALSLEITNPYIAENITYIAGDRVVTDPLCKPFSMGRNLICVYSKKHMNDVPEHAEKKRRANTRSLKEMASLLRGGSQLIWIAPSGGRDRPDPHTEEWFPAPFDSSAVDNMRRLTEHADVPVHIYPSALLCYDIMPPPPRVEKEIGEKRVVSYHGVGVSVLPEISFAEITASCENLGQAKEAYSKAMYDATSEQYNVLKSAIHGKMGIEASSPRVSLSQPWN